MINESTYIEKINELTFLKNELVSSKFLLNWLEKNRQLYNLTKYNNSCTHRTSPFPCFCYEKKADCQFITIYKKFKIIEDYSKYNEISKLLCEEYKKLKNNKNALTNWLNINFDFAINNLCSFDNYDGERKMRRSFINGKNHILDEYEYIIIYVNLILFKYNYEFKKIFNNLFFQEKFLPKKLYEYRESLENFE